MDPGPPVESKSKKDVSSPGKKSEASTAGGSSTNVPTSTPLERPAEEIFASRWLSADELYASDKLCQNVWNDHELLDYLGGGRCGRVLLVKHKPTNTQMALKLCSMMRIGRGILTEKGPAMAISDFQQRPSKFNRAEVEIVLEHVRLERLVLRCLLCLCPFVMEIDERCLYTCVYDDVNGELGFPMRPDVGNFFQIWLELNEEVKEKDSPLVTDAFRSLLVFWAAQMADGLRFLHKCRIVHSDIHLRNYVMGSDGYIRLADFGSCSVSLLDAPESIARVNSSNRLIVNEMWRRLKGEDPPVAPPTLSKSSSSAKREPGQLADASEEKARRYDYFCLAKTLVMLDWPFNSPWCDEMKINVWDEDTLLKKCPPNSAILQGDLLDFISQLSKHCQGQLLETCHPDNLIKHRLFREIDFEKLRAKALPAPIHPVLKDAMPLRLGWNAEVSRQDVQLTQQAVQFHKAYCAGISKEQKDLFRIKFIG